MSYEKTGQEAGAVAEEPLENQVSLTPEGRHRFIEVYERRMSQEITHPVFGYQISYRRILEVQAKLLGRYLMGEIPDYPQFTTR